ncbi:MAG: bifunctional riboflavin kinase/FAD synthetase [Candidatus Dadabacteria bacterium]|nr:bifunctional riboflavin kinase/FAD synthetase [Candidatus Dadabacteria bacterium]MYC39435.1 bifunctional riboflavin kinase/FAD synthetase [Candidatus Dadabacteria bacterium]
MEIIIDPKQPLDFQTSAGIGNFDGIHLGHKKIIDAVKQRSRENSMRSCVITFDPHPQKVLGRKEVSLIFPLSRRFEMLESTGIDAVVCLNFTHELSEVSAENFVKDILLDRLRIKNIVVGPGFSFGHKRQGNVDLLRSMGETHGFNTVVAEAARVNDWVVSSSAIRSLVRDGEISEANRFFGYDYYIEGVVVEGERRGRKLGFPTVNLDTEWEILPKPGVYATYVKLSDGSHESITNIGVRPTFEESKLTVETHIFDFNEDLYGKKFRVNFVERLRDEKRFENVDKLVEQINHDIAAVHRILRGHPKDERIWK